jgi:outer membrane immunogenic protein
MRKNVIAGALAAGAILIAGSAMAADMPARAPMLMKAPPPAFSWTGCYLGAGGGYGMWTQDTYQSRPALVPTQTPTETGGGKGWFGTASVGCDYQVASSWVIGVQGDWDFSALKGNPNFGNGLIAEDENDSWTWAAGGRIGYVVIPQLLGYVSGGYTQAHFDQINFVNDVSGLPATVFVAANNYNGWYLGSGYEYGISFLPGLFWKTEYRFSSFQAADLPHQFVATGLSNGTSSNSQKWIQTIRSELVWRFNLFH